MLLSLAYLTVTNLFAALRLLPMSDRDKDAEILALRHQLTVLERQLDEILSDVGIRVILTGVRIPRMNAIMERWVQTCRHELLVRTLIWNEHHLRHALRQFELHYNLHRPHQAMH